MAKESSGARKVRVGTCPSCRLAVYDNNVVDYLGEKMHPECHEAQRREVARWNADVRADRRLA